MNPTLKRFSINAMGSFCEVQIFDESRINAKNVTRKLSSEVHRLENKFSRYRSNSFVSEINFSAGNRMGVRIDSETQKLFEHAQSCYEQSNGLFDVTAGVLNQAWDFKSGRVPDQSEIDELLELVGFNRLSWRKSRLMLPAKMQIDFGGIVKEYAADAVANLARRLGVKHGLINVGGDFAVIGPQPGDMPWPIGVADPKGDGSLMAKIEIMDGGLASSGDYERFFVHEGRRYSHILNPKTGWPCSGLRAVSVAGNLCTVAGSIATIAMLKEEPAGVEWLQQSELAHVYMNSAEEVKGTGLGTIESK